MREDANDEERSDSETLPSPRESSAEAPRRAASAVFPDWAGTGEGQAAYREIGRLVCQRIHLPLVYRGIHEILAASMPAKNIYVAVIEGTEHLRFPYYIDELEPENQLAIYPREGLTAHLIDAGRSLWLRREPDLLQRVLYIGPRPTDWAGFPLRGRDGSVIGAFVVQTYDPAERYTESDLALLEFAAGQLSIALQLHLYDRDIAIGKIASLVDETALLEELCEGIHRTTALLIPAAERCFIIARVSESSWRFKPVYWRDDMDDWDRIDWPMDRGLSAEVYRQGASVIYERDKATLPSDFVPIGTEPEFWLGCPLKIGPKTIGVVVVQSYDPDLPLTREDEATLNCIAPHIALAMGRSTVFELTRRGGGGL